MNERKKYIFVFLLTVGVFVSVFLFNSFLNKKRIEHIDDLQQEISVDLVANETQFDLLKNAPCEVILSRPILSEQLDEMGKKLSFMEETQGSSGRHFLMVKKYYSLLEVKDYLLSQEIAKKCGQQTDTIVYLYGQECSECTKQGYVLSEIKRRYPWVRIYSFDRDLDFSLIDTFTGIYDLTEEAPILIINQSKYAGFHGLDEIESILPSLKERKEEEEIKAEAERFLLEHDELSLDREQLHFLNFDSDKKEVLIFQYRIGKGEKDLVQIKVLRVDGVYKIIDSPYIDFLHELKSSSGEIKV